MKIIILLSTFEIKFNLRASNVPQVVSVEGVVRVNALSLRSKNKI